MIAVLYDFDIAIIQLYFGFVIIVFGSICSYLLIEKLNEWEKKS